MHSLTSALDGGEWSASCPGPFTSKERAPGTHWVGCWVGPRAVLDAVVKRKILLHIHTYIHTYIHTSVRTRTNAREFKYAQDVRT
jgi:hypothetical protein